MTQYVLKRLGLALLTLVLLSLIIFFAGSVLPGNPGRAILGPFASEHAVQALNQALGVNRPLVSQYWSWATGILHGDLGSSYQFRAPGEWFVRKYMKDAEVRPLCRKDGPQRKWKLCASACSCR